MGRLPRMSTQLRTMHIDLESILLHAESLNKKIEITGHLEQQGFYRPLEIQEGVAEWTQ